MRTPRSHHKGRVSAPTFYKPWLKPSAVPGLKLDYHKLRLYSMLWFLSSYLQTHNHGIVAFGHYCYRTMVIVTSISSSNRIANVYILQPYWFSVFFTGAGTTSLHHWRATRYGTTVCWVPETFSWGKHIRSVTRIKFCMLNPLHQRCFNMQIIWGIWQ